MFKTHSATIYVLFFLLMATYSQAAEEQATLQTETSKLQFVLQGSQSQLSLGTKSYSEYGIKPMMVFFPFRRLALHGSYFAVVKPDGSSNLNGLGFGGKYYLNGSGTAFSFKNANTTINGSPIVAYYLGMEFLSRDLRSNSVNLNYTGFSYLAGADWHFHYKWFLNFEAGYANLKNALGSTNAQDLKIMSFGLALGVMI